MTKPQKSLLTVAYIPLVRTSIRTHINVGRARSDVFGQTLVSDSSALWKVKHKSFGGQLIISVISSIYMGDLHIASDL